LNELTALQKIGLPNVANPGNATVFIYSNTEENGSFVTHKNRPSASGCTDNCSHKRGLRKRQFDDRR
jgi:hypothetical protein